MENIKFYIPIYADVVDLAKNGLDVKSAVIDQMQQGDPSVDDIAVDLYDKFGDSDEVVEAIEGDDFYNFVVPNPDSLIVDRDETFALGFHNGDCNTVAFGINCEFDVEKWANTYGFEEIEKER